MERAVVWCCGAEEAARALAGLQPLRVPPLNVLGTENDADPDGPMYPQRQLATLATRARFPVLPSLDAAAAALLARRKREQRLRPRPAARAR